MRRDETRYLEVVQSTVNLFRLLFDLELKAAQDWFNPGHEDYFHINDPQRFIARIKPSCLGETFDYSKY